MDCIKNMINDILTSLSMSHILQRLGPIYSHAKFTAIMDTLEANVIVSVGDEWAIVCRTLTSYAKVCPVSSAR